MQDSKTQSHDGDRNSPFETADSLPNASGTKRPLNRALIVCIVIGVVFILYLLAARTVTVSSNAEGFLVDDNSFLGFSLGDRLLLLPGLHTLKVSAPGYTPRDVTVDLNDDKNTLVNVELQPLPGQLLINSDVDAQVYVNGELAGASNTTLADIAAGTHQLRVTATHYKPFEQTIVIEGRHKTLTLDAPMQPDWITQEIISIPAGAEVFVDQQAAGVTPTTITLPRGPRQVQVQLAGHQTWQQILNIDPDQPFTLPAIELQPALVALEITSVPSGAQVTIDGLYQGETPLNSTLAPATSATVVLIKDGYRTQQREVSLVSARKLHVDMAATLGRINLNVTPSNAKVTVNGRQQRDKNDGKGNRYSLQLPTHPHTLIVSAPGHKSKRLKLTPRAELAQHLNVSLLTLEQARWESTPDLLQSPTGQELKIFKPEATFTMGATRREQGRRANETQHQVRLNRPFYLATKPVTNEDFRRFQRFHSSGNIKGKSLNGEQQPVVNISWLQAVQFCNWLSQQDNLEPVYTLADDQLQSVNMNSNGYRLPTEAEWAWAARHQNSTMKTYPWGSNRVSPPAQSANYADAQTLGLIGKALPGYEDGDRVTSVVGSYSPNQKGLYDLAGNVSEWIHDYYGIKTGLSLKATLNPVGPASGDGHVIRGSSWKSASLSELRLAYRDSGNGKQDNVGFRIARYVFEGK